MEHSRANTFDNRLLQSEGCCTHGLQDTSSSAPTARGSPTLPLAATGLPIYISELDVNFADDARHAGRLRDLFSLFWAHPSVVGVTHGGHLQGRMWRPNAYLVRADGSERAGLQWLTCYVAGGGGACTVPEYIAPTRRRGHRPGAED